MLGGAIGRISQGSTDHDEQGRGQSSGTNIPAGPLWYPNLAPVLGTTRRFVRHRKLETSGLLRPVIKLA